jgi:hypothetical protein
VLRGRRDRVNPDYGNSSPNANSESDKEKSEMSVGPEPRVVSRDLDERALADQTTIPTDELARGEVFDLDESGLLVLRSASNLYANVLLERLQK